MNKRALVTIIVAAYHSSAYILDALESCAAQSYELHYMSTLEKL